LSGHASDLASQASQASEPPRYVLLSVTHHAKNNLSAELQATAGRVSGINLASSPIRTGTSSYEIDSTLLPTQPSQQNRPAPDIFYRNAAQVLPVSIAYRASIQDAQGRQIAPRPNAPGSQTALVIGAPGQQLSTERDHRIKVQFAWQRGAQQPKPFEPPRTRQAQRHAGPRRRRPEHRRLGARGHRPSSNSRPQFGGGPWPCHDGMSIPPRNGRLIFFDE
jgi:uncharacterized protein involved in type VI secretion and phage assembly